MRHILTLLLITVSSILNAQVGSTCSNPFVLSLPFSGSSMTTAGFGDNYDENSACGSDYMNGNDYVMTYTPAADECVTFNLSNTSSKYNRGMFLLDGCPDTGATCIATDQGSFITPTDGFTDVNLIGGQTYYLIISSDIWATGGVQTITFDLDITGGPCPTCTDGIRNGDEENIDCGGSCPNTCVGKNCGDALEITSLPFKALDNTTDNMGNSSSSYSCSGGSGQNGEDYFYKYTATANDTCVTIALEDLRTDNIELFLYEGGCPGTGTCISTSTYRVPVTAYSNGVFMQNISLTNGVDYYIIIDGTSSDNDFDFSMGNYCTAPECGVTNDPASDLCSTATVLDNIEGFCGTTFLSYTTSPSDDPDETSDEFCASIENNSWFKFIASETSSVINVYVYDCIGAAKKGIQMIIYETSDCNTYTPVSNCWNPGIETNGTIEASGLVIGNEYYIMIDGYAGEECNYTIEAETGIALSSASISNLISSCKNDKTLLKWYTSESSNEIRMSVMRSKDGIYFESIKTLIHDGTNKVYSYIDENNKTANYYRIEMEDLNGDISYSKTVYNECKSILDDLIIYPNPAKDFITIKGVDIEDSEIKLFNTLGQQLTIYTVVKKDEIQINVQNIERGVYYINVKLGNQVINKKVVLN